MVSMWTIQNFQMNDSAPHLLEPKLFLLGRARQPIRDSVCSVADDRSGNCMMAQNGNMYRKVVLQGRAAWQVKESTERGQWNDAKADLG